MKKYAEVRAEALRKKAELEAERDEAKAQKQSDIVTKPDYEWANLAGSAIDLAQAAMEAGDIAQATYHMTASHTFAELANWKRMAMYHEDWLIYGKH
jgi:hypothetical protein